MRMPIEQPRQSGQEPTKVYLQAWKTALHRRLRRSENIVDCNGKRFSEQLVRLRTRRAQLRNGFILDLTRCSELIAAVAIGGSRRSYFGISI
jgi:hypothetical protein